MFDESRIGSVLRGYASQYLTSMCDDTRMKIDDQVYEYLQLVIEDEASRNDYQIYYNTKKMGGGEK
jgi:hypothetical protein